MADWAGPFHVPRMSSAKFTAMRLAYVEKHGYTVTVPGFEDIIKLKRFPPLSNEEKTLWRRRQYDQISEPRRSEIYAEKAKKKERFLAMLSSPTPDIAFAAGAIMTSIDDAQDAVSTLACIGMIVAKLMPAAAQRLVMGPLGLVMAASDIANLLNIYSHLGVSGRAQKKIKDSLTESNPFSSKGKAHRAARLKRFKPSAGNALEALQVSEDIFGIGISLGPLVGLAQDMFFGLGRTLQGKKVMVHIPPYHLQAHDQIAMRCLKSSACLHFLDNKATRDDIINSMVGSNLAMQVAYTYLQRWNPIDQVDGINNYEMRAPEPSCPLTLEAMQEEVMDPLSLCVWPGLNKRYATPLELSEIAQDAIVPNLERFASENKHDPESALLLRSATHFGINTIAAIEGPEQVAFDYTAMSRAVHKILDNGYVYPPDVTPFQRHKFETWIGSFEGQDYVPTFWDIHRYTRETFGFSFVLADTITRDQRSLSGK